MTEAPQIRILQLDVMRGFAVLGIYWINVVIFALPHGAYALPTLWGNAPELNIAAWVFSELAVEGSMRGLFSLLFGASALVFLQEARLDKQGVALVDRFYRRNLLLILFGLIHAYLLLWPYDVLYAYGLFGLFIFPLRKLKPLTLMLAGCLLLLAGELTLNDLLEPAVQEPAEAKTRGIVMLPADEETAPAGDDSLRDYALLQMESDVAIHQSGYFTIFIDQLNNVVEEQSTYMYTIHVFDIAGMMLIGMALLKWGVLSGQWRRRSYVALMVGGYLVGFLFRGLGIYNELNHGFSVDVAYQQALSVDYDLGRLPVTLGHVGLLGLITQAWWMKWMANALATVGRLALTNYIMQTILSIFLFYGFGLALFGELERYQLIYLCLGLWAFQLAFSHLWLRYYLQGPLEWLWRSLIYGQRQPLRRGR